MYAVKGEPAFLPLTGPFTKKVFSIPLCYFSTVFHAE